MAGSTFQPPIHLDPSQDAPQQTAFINQNFQQIASTLETNSFRIFSSGSTSVSAGAGPTTSWTTIAHGLGFAPIVFAYLNNVTITAGTLTITSTGNLQLPTFVSLTGDTILSTAVSSATARPALITSSYLYTVADASNLYVILSNQAGSSIPALTVQYYLVQLPST